MQVAGTGRDRDGAATKSNPSLGSPGADLNNAPPTHPPEGVPPPPRKNRGDRGSDHVACLPRLEAQRIKITVESTLQIVVRRENKIIPS